MRYILLFLPLIFSLQVNAIEITGSENLTLISNVKQEYQRLSPQLQQSLVTIRLAQSSKMSSYCLYPSAGCAIPPASLYLKPLPVNVVSIYLQLMFAVTGSEILQDFASGSTVILSTSSIKRSPQLLAHEAAHTRTYQLELLSPLFREAWENVSYRELGKLPYQEMPTIALSLEEEYRPIDGCINSYGCTSFYEDVATFTQLVAAGGNQQPVQELMNLPIYRQKLELLYQYGFITEKDYEEIISIHSE